MTTPTPVSTDQPAMHAGRSALRAPATVLHHPVFMPQPNEPIHAYAARLRAMHHHLTMLIEAVERGMSARRPDPGVATAERARHAPQPPRIVAVASAPRAASGTAPAPAPAGRPAAAARPASDDRRREDVDRRVGQRDRRQGHPDRRRGLIDLRAVKVERRVGPRDRRSGRRDRRMGHERRADARRAQPVSTTPQLDPVAVFWGVNITCWLGVTAVAMIWGVG